MALGTPAHLSFSAASGSSATSGSFTPAAGAEIFVFGWTRRQFELSGALTITDTAGLSWTEVCAGTHTHTTGSNRQWLRLVCWRATAAASPPSMTVTISGANGQGATVSVLQITDGADAAVRQFKFGVSETGDPSVTLDSAPKADAFVIGSANMEGDSWPMTSPTGFTELHDTAGQGRHATAYDITAPTAGPHAWTSVNYQSIAALIELNDIAKPTGVSAAGAAGTVQAAGAGSTGVSTGVAGVSSSASAGTAAAATGAPAPVTGVLATAAAGATAARGGVTQAVTASALAAAIGTLDGIGQARASLSGLAAAATAGSAVAFGETPQIAGVSGVSLLGTITVTSGPVIAITGVSAASSVGLAAVREDGWVPVPQTSEVWTYA